MRQSWLHDDRRHAGRVRIVKLQRNQGTIFNSKVEIESQMEDMAKKYSKEKA